MDNVLLCFKNAIDDATLTAASQSLGGITLSTTNLKIPVVSKFTRANTTRPNGLWVRAALARITNPALVALSYHNFTAGGLMRVRLGMAPMDIDFTEGLETDPRLVFTGGGGGTFFAFNGVQVNSAVVDSITPRVDYDRATFDNGFTNSDDLTQATWSATAGQIVDANTVFLGPNAQLVEAMPIRVGTYTITGEARLVSGDGGFAVKVKDTADHTSTTVTAGTDWTPFSLTAAATANGWTTGNAGLVKNASPGLLQLRKLQVYFGTAARPFLGTRSARLCRPRGLLKEPASQNDLLRSDDQTNAAYTKTGTSTVTANVQANLSGTVSMDRFNSTATNDALAQQITVGGTTTRGLQMVFYAPGSSETNAALQISWNTGGTTQTVQINFNPSTGAFISTSATGATLGVFGLDDYGDGYFRVFVLGTGTNASNTKVTSSVILATASRNLTLTAWQNEANMVSSYIATGATAVSRAADSILISGSNFDFFLNAGEGTLYTEAMAAANALNLSSGSFTLASIKNGAGSNAWNHRFLASTTTPAADVTTTTGWDSTDSAVSAMTTVRMASRLRANDFAYYKDGTQVQTTASFGMVTGVDQSELGGSGNAGPCWLQRITFWPRGLSNTELAALTTSGPSAIDYDSGWVKALQSNLLQDLADPIWGRKMDVQIQIPAATFGRYALVMIRDSGRSIGANSDFNIIGRIFISTYAFRPQVNMAVGLQDGHLDYSEKTKSVGGSYWTTARLRPKTVAMSFDRLTPSEGDKVHELTEIIGTVDEVYYMPDTSDAAFSQRYGFLGQASQINPLQYPYFGNRTLAFQLEQKV